ncbi:hypothetical protein SAMN02745664_10160 [Moraxella cuniculi DSM 21768]|uniref:Lysozyme inhibitor LprI N-terminal domain-containing protein n=1 Tax=Moraxella cuniculi DSM 21768 TaxID=1122245 RepID=A0A1N7D7T3_9GAMM|nr:hypothetical protein [Moraxella cuniculi]OOS07890.1 hypothetical protein B0189_00595 [Moraxella cuniculi]SIR71881.1 hypothetical protein SAMN02745664_10160 [Moraxella cuniculi DSM 21768]
MKIYHLITATATALLLLTTAPAQANQAKFKKIERELKQCSKDARGSYVYGSCVIGAVDDYRKLMNASKRSKLKQAERACAIKAAREESNFDYDHDTYGLESLSNAGRIGAAECQLKAARRIAKQR